MEQVFKETGVPVSAIYKARLYYTLEDGRLSFENSKAARFSKWLKAIMSSLFFFVILKEMSKAVVLGSHFDPVVSALGLLGMAAMYYLFWDWFTNHENIAIRLGEKQANFRGSGDSEGPVDMAQNDTPGRLALLREKVNRFLEKRTRRISKAQTSV